MIEQPQINSILDSIKYKIVDRKLSFAKLDRILHNAFHERYTNMVFKTERDIEGNDAYITTSGNFCPKYSFNWIRGLNVEREDQIRAIIYIPEKEIRSGWFGRKYFVIPSFFFDRFKFLLSETLQHELIHQYQSDCSETAILSLNQRYKQSNFNIQEVKAQLKGTNVTYTNKDEKEAYYLADHSEIDTHAHDACLEMTKYLTQDEIYAFLNDIKALRLRYRSLAHSRINMGMPTFSSYWYHFSKGDPKIWKKFQKKVYKYLQYDTCHWKD